MQPTRRTQPYRKGPRAPGVVLTNVKRGRTLYGQNPMDAKRKAQKKIRIRRRKR